MGVYAKGLAGDLPKFFVGVNLLGIDSWSRDLAPRLCLCANLSGYLFGVSSGQASSSSVSITFCSIQFALPIPLTAASVYFWVFGYSRTSPCNFDACSFSLFNATFELLSILLLCLRSLFCGESCSLFLFRCFVSSSEESAKVSRNVLSYLSSLLSSSDFSGTPTCTVFIGVLINFGVGFLYPYHHPNPLPCSYFRPSFLSIKCSI